jgi:hypothetical protein
MFHKVLLALALTGVVSASAAYAHDASLHKGKAIVGKVVVCHLLEQVASFVELLSPHTKLNLEAAL